MQDFKIDATIEFKRERNDWLSNLLKCEKKDAEDDMILAYHRVKMEYVNHNLIIIIDTVFTASVDLKDVFRSIHQVLNLTRKKTLVFITDFLKMTLK